MQINSKSYQIKLSNQSNAKSERSDQKHYFTENEHAFSTQIAVEVYEEDRLISSALISGTAGGTGIHEHSQIVTNEYMILCCSDHLFHLSLPHLELNWKVQADTATCFGMYPLEQDFIIHGELEISRISKDGTILWKVSGADIFTTLEGNTNDFYITDNFIFATDWNHQKYQIDFNGNLIHS